MKKVIQVKPYELYGKVILFKGEMLRLYAKCQDENSFIAYKIFYDDALDFYDSTIGSNGKTEDIIIPFEAVEHALNFMTLDNYQIMEV